MRPRLRHAITVLLAATAALAPSACADGDTGTSAHQDAETDTTVAPDGAERDASPDVASPEDTLVAADTAAPEDTLVAADTAPPEDTLAAADTAAPPGPWDGPVEPAAVPAVVDQRGTYLATHTSCALCHASSTQSTALRDASGRPIGMHTLWRSSMMANAARDPFWRAMVSAEAARRPSVAGAITAKCMRCHAPALSAERELSDGPAVTLADRDASGLDGNLARDGVTCTVCHQIEPDTLGTDASFDGHFAIHRVKEISAPHTNLVPGPMAPVSGFTPVTRDHMRDSGLCATCHTLRTGSLDADGIPTGHTLVEQSPYLEWRNSAFTTEGTPGPQAASCQACHVPTLDEDGQPIVTKVATAPSGGDFAPIAARSPVGRHLYVGGNTLISGLFRDFQAILNPGVPVAAFEATAAAARRQLEHDTATVTVLSATQDGATLHVRVRISNRAGHKLPTGYPSRRLWLSLVAQDAADAVVVASGTTDADGRIVGADGAPLPSEHPGGAPLPHRDLVNDPDAVVVYEAVMADPDGTPTWSLMSASRYHKDNRLLPEGYSPTHADAAATAPAAVDGDANFTGGADEVTYALTLPLGRTVARVTVSALYQAVSARFAAELFCVRTEAVANFEWLYERADKAPVVVARDVVDL